MKEAMEQLKKSSGYSFVFSSSDVDTNKRVSISSQNSSIKDIVKQILQGQSGLDYEIQGKKIIIKKGPHIHYRFKGSRPTTSFVNPPMRIPARTPATSSAGA